MKEFPIEMEDLQLVFLVKMLELQFNITPEDIHTIYPYGSIVYGTNTNQSDEDYVVIVDGINDDVHLQFESDFLDIHIITVDHFKFLLNRCDIMALEAYFSKWPIKNDLEIDFELNLPALRKSISHTVSNSWVKAKKKVKLENEDSWVGYKSLFHAIRILDFGIQIAETGKIEDYKRVSHLWTDILERVDRGDDFESIIKHFKPIQNANQTIFRKLAPKE